MSTQPIKCVSKEEFIGVSDKTELIASFNGFLRTFNDQGILCITPDYIKNQTPVYLGQNNFQDINDGYGRTNSLIYNLGPEHVNGFFYHGNASTQYHLFSGVHFNDDLSGIRANAETIYFYLNNNQAKDVSSAISHIKHLAADNKYKYIAYLHDCESVASDTFHYANFTKHYTHYLTKSELIQSNFVESVLLKNQYYIDALTYYVPERDSLNQILRDISGENFREILPIIEFCQNLTIIKDTNTDTDTDIDININQGEIFKLEPFIQNAYNAKNDIIKITLDVWSDIFKIKETGINLIENECLGFEDLYYIQTLLSHFKKITNDDNISPLLKKLLFLKVTSYLNDKVNLFNDLVDTDINSIFLRKLILSNENITESVSKICPQLPDNEYCKDLIATDIDNIAGKVRDFDMFDDCELG